MNLAAGLALRAVKWKILRPWYSLFMTFVKAEGDTSVAVTTEDQKNEWEYEGFDPQQDAFLVETADGRAAGYAALFDVKEHCDLSGDIYIHPQFKGRVLVWLYWRRWRPAARIMCSSHLPVSASSFAWPGQQGRKRQGCFCPGSL